jgi:hypothetical protein
VYVYTKDMRMRSLVTEKAAGRRKIVELQRNVAAEVGCTN